MVQESESARATEIHVALGWLGELKRRLSETRP
jgi:hypothetical protein